MVFYYQRNEYDATLPNSLLILYYAIIIIMKYFHRDSPYFDNSIINYSPMR